MTSTTIRILGASAAVIALAFSGCTLGSGDSEGSQTRDEPLSDHSSPQWIYEGLLPQLEKPFIHISTSVHTVRVTGFLPDWFVEEERPLPFYAKKDVKGGRQRITVVYPTATGAPGTKAPAWGLHQWLRAYAYYPSNDAAPWGGFPYLEYDNAKDPDGARFIAMHGPIDTAADGDWQLRRGKVSHGCNRMLGEHVVELAHLLGLNMRKPHSADEKWLNIYTKVIDEPDTWNGHRIDVAYPALPEVVRPKGPNVVKFKTWLSDTFPRFVCAYEPSRPLNKHHCDYLAKNSKNPVTGKAW